MKTKTNARKGHRDTLKAAMRKSRTTRPTTEFLPGILAAEKIISKMDPADHAALWRRRESQPKDGFLRMWSGLFLDAQGEANAACEEFLAAGELGCAHWRVGWYLAQAARRAGRLDLVDKACAAVVAANPDFSLAREFPKHVRGYYGRDDHDKIIEQFFQDEPARSKVFVEVGAFDGVHYSNVRRLQEQHGWSGVSVESVEKLTTILEESSVTEMDLLSVTAEGRGLEVLRSLDFSKVQPQLIVMEYGQHREAIIKFLSDQGYSLILDNQRDLFMARLNHLADTELQLPATRNFTGHTGRPAYEEIQKEAESRLHEWIQKPPGEVERIVIVGGYLGHEVKSFLANYPKAEIHIFEPSRRYFGPLAKIYAGNPQVRCHNLAVAERCGWLRFHEGSLEGVGSLLPLKTQADSQTWIPENFRPAEDYEVQAVTLDSFEPLRGKAIDLLWCDVQGAELKVLSGASRTLRRCHSLFLEVAITKMSYEGQCRLGELQRLGLAHGFYLAGIGLCPTGNGTGNSLWLRMKGQTESLAGGAETRFSNDWFAPHEKHWNEQLVRWGIPRQPVRILEIGSYEGRSACWFLTHLMEHRDSHLTCLDAWQQRSGAKVYEKDMEKVFETFQQNISATGKAGQVTTHRGSSKEILPNLPAESFDLIYVDGDHSATGAYTDSIEAYRLLKPGGLLLWDDYYWTPSVKEGVDQACAQLGISVERFGNNASHVKPGAAAVSKQSRAKIVGLVPARNEGPRIAFCLRALARYTDAIVYLDDCSDDDTVATVESLAAECRVEKILRKTKWHRDEPGDRNALLQAGRALGGTHFIVLDADEAFTANCGDNQLLRNLILALQPGDSLALNWIQLWRGVEQYRFDESVWTWNSKAVIFADDGCCSYSSEFIHTPRVPGNLSGRCHSLPGYAHGLLHFQFVHWRNLLVKQAWYRCLEHIREPQKPIEEINRRYAPSKDETGLGLKAAPVEWLAGYPFFDRASVSEPETWRETQVLDWFKQFGRDHFRQLDIWDIAWGQPKETVKPLASECRIRPHCAPEEVRLAQSLIQNAQAGMAGGDLSGACAALAAALKIVPNDANLAVVHGNLLAALADPAGARWEYHRAIALQPNHAAARSQLQLLGSRPNPLAPIAQPIPTASPHSSPVPASSGAPVGQLPKVAQDCLEQAEKYFKKGKLAEARVWLERVLQITPNETEVTLALGNLCFKLGDMPAAADAFTEAAEKRPKDATLQVLLATAAVQAGRISVFEKALAQALAIDPQNAGALHLLAKLNLEQGRLTDAVNAWSKILQRDENNIDALVGLGVCRFKLGDRVQAQQSFERVLQLQPNHSLARENLRAAQTAVHPPSAQPETNRLPQTTPLAPLVSAIVSTYKSERFMRGCLEDLTGQTLFASGQLEIIVVDTGSPQNERVIVEEFQRRFPNLIYLRTEDRETIYAAWNRGVQAARGKYLTSANTDDRHRADALEVMAACLEQHPEVALAYADQLISDVPNETFAEAQADFRWDWPKYSYEELESRCIVGSQPLWRRSLHDKYGLFLPELNSAGDYDFWLRIGKTESFYRLPDILGVYYRNPTGCELGGGKSVRETKDIRQRHGILDRKVLDSCSVPVPISEEELDKLPFRSKIKKPRRRTLPKITGFDPAAPDYANTPVSPMRAVRDYRPADPTAKPAVTIVTPFFNTGDIFDETARTVLGQTFQQWEWLIINDASTNPEARRVLNRYRQSDPRIKVIDQPRNGGPGAARNRGAQMAAAEYLVLLDSDDLLEPTALEKWFWHLESHPEYAFVKGFSVGFGAKNYLWTNGFHCGKAFLKENLVDLTSMIRKSAFLKAGGHAEQMRHGFEDWEFWLRCASHGLWGGTVPEHLDWYRRRENHNDRWSNWDNGKQQQAALAELRKKYHRLEKDFPTPKPAPLQPFAKISLEAAARNQLQKTKPRLLFILPWMTLGGADKFNLDLLEQLTTRGWEVTCVTTLTGDHSWMPEFSRSTTDLFPLSHFLEMSDYPRFLSYLIQSRQIDTVLISNSLAGYQLLPFLRSRFPEVAFLDYCHMEQEDWLQGGYPQLSVKSAPCFDLSVVSSSHLKRWMTDRSRQPNEVEVCHTNINASQWEPDPLIRQQVRGQLDLPDNHPIILYAGRVVEQKQPRVFAETIRLLRAQHGNFTALVAGDGPDLPWLKDFVAQHQLAGNVRFMGGVSNQRVRELMRGSDIFFLPSQWEGIALSIFEAMACGLAVVGADVGGQRELVTPGCGFLLPRGDATSEAKAYAAVLAELVADAGRTRAVGQAARGRVTQNFKLDQMGDRMIALFQQARERLKARTANPVTLETGLATAAQVVEIGRIPLFLNAALAFVGKKELPPALELLRHVRDLAQLARDQELQRSMEATIAKFEGFLKTQPRPPTPTHKPTDAATPLVSVVIPCYNYGHLLPEAVESVLHQSFQDFEIIIINDGSTDDTVAVAERLIQQHGSRHRLRLINQPNSGQPAAARNAGIAAAVGQYILPLDADDKIAPSFLKRTVAALESAPEIGVAYTHIQHFGATQSVYKCGAFDRAVLARDNVLPYCSLYRRKLWEEAGGYRLMGYEDWDFWLTLVERGCQGRLVPEPLFCYRKHGQGMLNQDNQKRERIIAQLVCHHPKLYDAASQKSASEVLDRHAATQAKPAVAPQNVASVAARRSPLRITYLINSILGVTGGNQTLLRQAEEMRRRGHDVTIVTYSPKPDWFQFETRVIQAPAGQPMAPSVPPSDVVVATYFVNAVELRAIQAPVKVYYAQGDQFVFEDATMADTAQNRQLRQLSRASYLLPGLRFVPNSQNLAAAVQKLCGRTPDAILPVCTDQTIFRPMQRSLAGSRARLLIVGPDARGTTAEPLMFKGIQDIHDALQILAPKYPHFTPVRMSGTAPDIFARFPCEFYVAPNDELKTVLYGTAHIHIYASHYDSCPRPPQEAMAAGCAVVCTDTGGAREYCRDGENALLVPVKSPAAIAAAVERLIRDHGLREKLAQGGLATARQFPREREWNEWEAIIFRFMDEAARPAAITAQASKVSIAAKPDKAVAAVKLPPCARIGYLGRARDEARKKHYPAAWAETVAAIAARPFHPEAWLLLGEIAQAAGDGASALLCGKRAARLAPDWKPTKKFLNGSHRGVTKPAWLVLPPAITDVRAEAAPRLSVCLIVKNEEQFLAQCLASVRSPASQIIVLDTGSTDRTVQIAREHGAEVHHFEWCDDFAAARNAALEHATGDWVLALDADEELMPNQAEILTREMQSAGVMAFRLPIVDKGREQEGCSYVPRLFRNAPGLFFLGRVHEQAFSSIEARCEEWNLRHLLGKTTLLHHGYVKEVVESRDKIARNLRLLRRAIEELPGEPNLLMNLGLELVRSGERAAGLGHYWQAAELLGARPDAQIAPELRETLLSQLSAHLLADKDFAGVAKLFQTPLAKRGGLTASHHFALGLALMELKQPAEAAGQMRECLTKRGQPALSPVNKEILRGGPSHCLALCHLALREMDAAAQAFAAALAAEPSSRRIRLDFARFQAGRGQALETLRLLNELAAETPQDAAIWQLGGQIALSRADFLEFARDWTGEAIKHFPAQPAIMMQRAEALLLTQNVEAALPLWRDAHSPNAPRQVAALVLCELLAGDCRRQFSAAEETIVSQEFVKWYRQLIAVGAHSVVHQLHERMDAARALLPSFARVWEAANRQAREALAV